MFISLEGPDGSGKTTQLPLLADYLRHLGYDVLATREPGGTLIGDQVRDILSNTTNITMRPRTELLLFQASRAQLVDEVIRPHIAKGGIVISDRYADSTVAYQGYGHGLDLGQLQSVVLFATGGLKPDLTLFLDIDVGEGLRRRSKGGGWNRLDAYDLEFHKRAYAGYQRLIAQEPERWVIIDARQPTQGVQTDIQRVVMDHLKRRPPAPANGGGVVNWGV
jgi:dTMP kinase